MATGLLWKEICTRLNEEEGAGLFKAIYHGTTIPKNVREKMDLTEEEGCELIEALRQDDAVLPKGIRDKWVEKE